MTTKKRPSKSEFEKRQRTLYNQISSSIYSGYLKPDEPLPSETQMIESSRLSRGSVRAVLKQLEDKNLIVRKRGSGSYVAPLPEHHLKEVNEILFLPPPLLSETGRELLPDFTAVRSAIIFEAIVHKLRDNGLECRRIYHCSNGRDEVENYLKSYKPKGAIILSYSYPDLDVVISKLRMLKIPVVAMIRECEEGVTSLSYDNTHIGQEAAKHLIDCGHKNIAIFTCDKEVLWAEQRTRGFQMICEKVLGINIKIFRGTQNVRGEVPIKTWEKMGRELLRKLQEEFPEATAVFCVNDIIASGCLHEAEKQRIQIPKELSVMGSGDDSMLLGYNMTTVSLEAYRTGILAAYSMLQHLSKERSSFTSAQINTKPTVVNHNMTVRSLKN